MGALPLTTWDEVAETTAVTSNPAAGVISVDVKTFTGRGRVTQVECTCVADATVATRRIVLQKVSTAGTLAVASGATFTATTTGVGRYARGWATAQEVSYAAISESDFAPGDILRILVTSGQAGDDLSAITYSYKEML